MNSTLIPCFLILLLAACHPAKTSEQNKTIPEGTTASGKREPVKDYFHFQGPINFNQQEFNLAWSSHPTENYYKHEYLPRGEGLEHYNTMILLELVLGNVTAKGLAEAKVEDMKKRKASDPLAIYQLSQNTATGEYLLGLRMSDANADTTTVVEWNVYRYKDFSNPGGQKGVELFGLSKRGYAEDGKAFVNDIHVNGKKYTSELMALPMPSIRLE